MNLLAIYSRYPDQESCIEYLETLCWGDRPVCPHCHGSHVARKADTDRVGRWNCHTCHSSFNVLSGTIFEGTRVPLQKWFLAIGLMVNAKKSLSSYQLARDLALTQQTALYMQHRIRAAMAQDDDRLLYGLLEADETYVGGKPRKQNKRDDDRPHPPGRGTSKTPVIGVVERYGEVRAQVADDLSGKGIVRFLKQKTNPAESMLITDEYRAYNAVRSMMRHTVINHSRAYADGDTHTNSIEGFWALLKRAWYGAHHHYTKKFMPLFVAEACWKYNARKNPMAFETFMRGCVA